MFVARVLVGDFALGDSKMRRPPEKPNKTQSYDSCVDNIHAPSIFVVFEKFQIYPEYILEYEEEKKSSCVISWEGAVTSTDDIISKEKQSHENLYLHGHHFVLAISELPGSSVLLYVFVNSILNFNLCKRTRFWLLRCSGFHVTFQLNEPPGFFFCLASGAGPIHEPDRMTELFRAQPP